MRNPDLLACSFKRGNMKKLKKLLKIKRETATVTNKTEKAMLPKLEKRSK